MKEIANPLSSAVTQGAKGMTSPIPTPDQPDTKAKRDSEALLAALISFSRDAIISASPQGLIQTWNDGALCAAVAVRKSMTPCWPLWCANRATRSSA